MKRGEQPAWFPLDDAEVMGDPFEMFSAWYDQAAEIVREPEAICVATADASGQPAARMVLLRNFDERGFVFHTNYESRKGHDIEENPKGAILWFIEEMGRQVRIEGRIEKLSAQESDAYFARRNRGHQIGAHASAQSQPIESRKALEARFLDTEAAFEGRDVPRPLYWGGYRLVPSHFEFWQQRPDRYHDRYFFDRDGVTWQIQRHQP
jgi:pyridoxamine 5'-phosphate oxidase